MPGAHAHFAHPNNNNGARSGNSGALRRSDAQQVPRNRSNSISSSTSTGSGSLTSSSPAELAACGSPASNEGQHANHALNGYSAQQQNIFQAPNPVSSAHFNNRTAPPSRPLVNERIR